VEIEHRDPPCQVSGHQHAFAIRQAGGTAAITVDKRQEITPLNVVPFGEFAFKAVRGGFVGVGDNQTDLGVAADGARLVWLAA
jgi:hypothetical protein